MTKTKTKAESRLVTLLLELGGERSKRKQAISTIRNVKRERKVGVEKEDEVYSEESLDREWS